MQSWKTLRRERILDFNKFLKIEKHTVELPDGRVIEDWPWIDSPDFVLVLPVTDRNTILLFQQVKYAVDGMSFAPVGGYLESNENPLEAAKRELKEEMGCETPDWISFGSYPVNGNHGGGKGNLFLAMNVRKTAEPIVDDLEEMQLKELTFGEVENLVLSGEIKAQGWLAVVAVGLLMLKKKLPSANWSGLQK